MFDTFGLEILSLWVRRVACRQSHRSIQLRGMRERTIVDGLWERLAPLVPTRTRRFRHPGRLRRDDRAALAGILYVLRTGIGWQDLPTAAFGVSGSTCWRRLREWHEQGVWQRLHEVLLAELRAADALDLAHAVVDSSHIRALKRGTTPARARSTAPAPAPSTI